MNMKAKTTKRGPYPGMAEKFRTVSLRLPESLIQDIDKVRAKTGLSFSAVTRLVLIKNIGRTDVNALMEE